jgi:hypothetical protein
MRCARPIFLGSLFDTSLRSGTSTLYHVWFCNERVKMSDCVPMQQIHVHSSTSVCGGVADLALSRLIHIQNHSVLETYSQSLAKCNARQAFPTIHYAVVPQTGSRLWPQGVLQLLKRSCRSFASLSNLHCSLWQHLCKTDAEILSISIAFWQRLPRFENNNSHPSESS